MDNEQNDDLARSITGGTLFAVFAILFFLIIYTVAGPHDTRCGATASCEDRVAASTKGGQHE